MRSPKDMRTIQIDITNACINECSNCTRFCGHHKKPYFMEYEMFKKAIDSLEGFENCIGIMGGEPTLHPKFDDIVKYATLNHPSKHNIKPGRNALLDFGRYNYDKNYILDETLNNRKGLGLWTSVCPSYYKHYELIQDSFSFQNVNDHQNPSLHQPLLISRKDLGIDDEMWIELRDKCWIQNQWSATITPKGAFFCEVAGALDMLFDGPGGWKVEKDWWKRTPEQFGEQLNWCEICGGAISNIGRLSSEGVDDISPALLEKLNEVESPKVKQKLFEIFNVKDEKKENMPQTNNRYLLNHSERISKSNKSLYPKQIVQKNIKEHNFKFFGELINNMFMKEKYNDWVCITDNEPIDNTIIDRLYKVVLNPGVVYKLPNDNSSFVFNKNASAIKNACFDGIKYCETKEDFLNLWDEDKVIQLDEKFDELRNPDIEWWVEYSKKVNDVEEELKEKCLNKIISDYK